MASLEAVSPGTAGVYANFSGLGSTWEGMKMVRDRLADFQMVMMEKPLPGEKEQSTTGSIAKTHANIRFNAEILKPLLVMMKDNRDKTPCKETLAKELQVCFQSCRLSPDVTKLSDEAWSVRYMYGLVKQLTYKPTPPRETWIQKFVRFSIFNIFFGVC